MATWNINGLTPNINELQMLMTSNKLDIVLISEAHCTNRSNLRIQGCCTYLTNHPDGTAHAGTAIVVKNTIKHHLLPEYKTEFLQATTINVEDRHGHLCISAVYCPPRHTITNAQFTHFFSTLGNRFIAGGDWNGKHVHWGSRLTTTRGRQLKQSVDENNLRTVSSLEPTYWPTDINKKPDLLDFFIIKGLSKNYLKAESCLDSSSDHTPVLLTLSSTVIEWERPATLSNARTDWTGFREYINGLLILNVKLKSTEDIDVALETFTTLLQTACWKNTPVLLNNNFIANHPLEIKQKILEKRRLRRVWHQSRHPADKTKLNKAIVELKSLIKDSNHNTLQCKLQSLSANSSTDYSLWKFTKTFDRPQITKPPIKTDSEEWARSSKQKANVFAEYLSTLFTPNDSMDENDETSITLNTELFYGTRTTPITPTSPHEIQNIIRNLDSKKAPGFDLITKEILLQLPRRAIVFMTILINAMLRIQYFPRIWKVSQIIMIHKHGKPQHDKSSYRSISLLPVMSKILEKIILHRILPVLKEQKIIPDHQFGFRKHHATIEQVHRVCATIRKSLEEKKYCSAVFLDVQQAFDKVWHKGLLYKISQSLPHKFYTILESYISNRIFCVKEMGEISEFYDIKAGVPQGSVLGPALYTLYTADLPTTPDVTTATFADDTAILASNQDPKLASITLQNALLRVHDWLQKWKIKTSAAKSVQITFTFRKGNCPPIKLGNSTLPQSDSVKYLGFHIDRRLTWKQHIKSKRDEISIKHKNLYWMLGKNARLSLDNKLLIYQMILKPTWMYGIQLWGSAKDSNIAIIQRVQNKILRSIANVPWYITNAELHQHLSVKTVKEEIRTASAKYQERLINHPNKLARQLTIQDYSNRLKRHNVLELQHRQ